MAPQASPASVREMMAWGEEHADQLHAAGGLQVLREEHGAPKGDGSAQNCVGEKNSP